LLGGDPLPMATVGKDFEPYGVWMDGCDLTRRHITILDTEFTAQAFITTDLDDNQITAFHPGAMNFAHLNSIEDAEDVDIGIVAPDGRDGMIVHATQMFEAGIPFIFDPGQGLPMFEGAELKRFIDQATWVAVNDYEGQMLQERTGWSAKEISQHVEALIVTRGGEGSVIFANGEEIVISPVEPAEILDPTGCGDAYRAGLMFGISRQMSWEDTGRLASLIGSIKIAHRGTQNHALSPETVGAAFEAAYGYAINL
ncbi:MAG: carbohydrate kinase family protein, partial [Gammaproteobacteria bacterium]|nr:carbohydrate kinase family protein [Gammaproteobacteria bacterium]